MSTNVTDLFFVQTPWSFEGCVTRCDKCNVSYCGIIRYTAFFIANPTPRPDDPTDFF
jgi:hypothetical protein